MFSHEEVVVRRGARTGLPVIAAVHSTALGTAVGGCRLWSYPRWEDGLRDALRLSDGMTRKCAVAGLPNGGGKMVVAVPEGRTLSGMERRDALLDAGDVVASFGGRYATGPDAGTGPDDMTVIAERTEHVFCCPGRSGDPSPYTALGVVASLKATCQVLTGSPELAGRRFVIVGAGHVGEQLARRLSGTGAELIISDVDAGKSALATELEATFLPPEQAVVAESDVLVPAALGGMLTHELVPRLRCAAVVGAANNQLAEPEVAEALHAREILWGPDYVVNAGGVIHAVAREILGDDRDKALSRVESIGDTLTAVFESAAATGRTPAAAADDLARERLLAADGGVCA